MLAPKLLQDHRLMAKRQVLTKGKVRQSSLFYSSSPNPAYPSPTPNNI